MSSVIRPPGLADYLALVALAAVWGANFILIKIGVETVPAAPFAVLRLASAAVAVWLLALHAGDSFRFPRRTWAPILLASLSGNTIPFILIGWGQERVDAGVAAILMAVMPLSTLLLAHLFTRDEKLSLRKSAGVALGLMGLLVLIGWSRLAQMGEETMRELAIAAAASCYGINALVTRSLAGLPRLSVVAVMLAASAVLAVPAALYSHPTLAFEPSTASIVAIVVLGVLPTGLGTIAMFALIGRLGASFFSQINFLVPVFGVLWGALLLAERPSINALAALAIILLGIAIARRPGRVS
jgi:drug/metabolite transporter (DMT)-like permease